MLPAGQSLCISVRCPSSSMDICRNCWLRRDVREALDLSQRRHRRRHSVSKWGKQVTKKSHQAEKSDNGCYCSLDIYERGAALFRLVRARRLFAISRQRPGTGRSPADSGECWPMLRLDIDGALFTAQVQLAQAPQRSARLPRLRPRHPTGDGEEAPTTQTQVTTVVILTAGAERREPGRRTMAAPHMQPALTMVTLGTP